MTYKFRQNLRYKSTFYLILCLYNKKHLKKNQCTNTIFRSKFIEIIILKVSINKLLMSRYLKENLILHS